MPEPKKVEIKQVLEDLEASELAFILTDKTNNIRRAETIIYDYNHRPNTSNRVFWPLAGVA